MVEGIIYFYILLHTAGVCPTIRGNNFRWQSRRRANKRNKVDTRTGMILPEDAIPSGQKKYFVPVVRDMTAKEKSQNQIELYSPCVCGSGKKFEHCCYKSKLQ